MKTFKQLREEVGSGPTNNTTGISVGPNDIGVNLKRKSIPNPLLTKKPLTRKF